jgi:mannosyltransferase
LKEFNLDEYYRLKIFSKPSETSLYYIVLVITVIFGAILRLHRIGRESLWLDEIDAITTSALPLKDIVKALTWHASPPLDYFILHFVIRFGHDESLVRLPAAGASILAIVIIFLAGKYLHSNGAGISASLIMTFSMPAIAYAQEARMYSLFMMLTCAILFFCALIIRNPNSWTYWIGLIFTSILILYTHYFGALIIISLGLLWFFAVILSKEKKKLLVKGILSLSMIGTSYIFSSHLTL